MEFKVNPEKILDMTEQQIDHIFELVRKAKEADLLDGDGHGIIPSDEYEKYGINVKGLEREFKSDLSAPTSTIYKNGKAVESMTGVWSLDFHRHIASECGLVSNVDYPELIGRGSQARVIAGAIDRWYNNYKGEDNA